MIHHVTTTGTGSAASQIIISTASAASTALLYWILRTVRRFMSEHEWLIKTTKANTEAIADNTNAIKRMLEQQERSQPRRR